MDNAYDMDSDEGCATTQTLVDLAMDVARALAPP
jgi:hypothetical protein